MEHYGRARIRRAWFSFFLGRGLQAVAGIVGLLWLVRLLPVGEFAVYGILLGLVELAAPLASLGLAAATQQFLPQAVVDGGARATVLQVLRWRVVSIAGTALLLAAAWPWLGAFAGVQAVLVPAPLVFLLVLAGLLAKVAPECLEAMLRHDYANTARALLPLVRLALLAVAVAGLAAVGVATVILVEIAAATVSLVAGLWLLARALQGSAGADAEAIASRRRHIVAYARDMAVVEWSNATVNPGALRLVAGYAGGADMAALYAFVQGLQLMLARYLPVIFLLPVVRPILVDRYVNRGEHQALQQVGNLLWKGNLLVLVPALVACLVAGDALVSLASGGKFPQGGIIAVLVLCVVIPQSSQRVLELAFQVSEQTPLLRKLAFISPLVMLAVLAAAQTGIEAMLLALVGGSVIWNLFALVVARGRRVPFHFERRAGAFFLLAFVLGSAVGKVLMHEWPAALALVVALLVVAVVLVPARIIDRQALALLRGRRGGNK